MRNIRETIEEYVREEKERKEKHIYISRRREVGDKQGTKMGRGDYGWLYRGGWRGVGRDRGLEKWMLGGGMMRIVLWTWVGRLVSMQRVATLTQTCQIRLG